MPDVLVVDDDPRVRALLVLSLLTNGYTVREAADGFDALLELAQGTPDALVMDLTMPRIGGFEVLEALHEKGATDELRILVHTSEDDPAVVERAAGLGIDEYFLKPIDPEAVVDAIGEHLVSEDGMAPVAHLPRHAARPAAKAAS